MSLELVFWYDCCVCVKADIIHIVWNLLYCSTMRVTRVKKCTFFAVYNISANYLTWKKAIGGVEGGLLVVCGVAFNQNRWYLCMRTTLPQSKCICSPPPFPIFTCVLLMNNSRYLMITFIIIHHHHHHVPRHVVCLESFRKSDFATSKI